MSFLEIQFPADISYGASGGPGYATDVVTFGSGFEQRNSKWSVARAVYDVSHNIKHQNQLDTLISFFRVCKGRANGFRFKDWSDFTCDHTTGKLEAGSGTGVPTYQMTKRYTFGGTEDRQIKKPVVASVVVKRAGVDCVYGAAAGNIAIDSTTGLVTFVTDVSGSVVSISTGAITSFTFAGSGGVVAALSVAQKVYITGVTGTAAAALNNKAHTITGKAGSVLSVSTNTAGLSGADGSAWKYPQSTDSLTWAGEFDVPCRFDTDQLKATIDTYATYSWGGVPIVELRTP